MARTGAKLAVWGLQISRQTGPGGGRESFKPESLKRLKKKEIKSKLNAAALPLATSFSVELIQECFEFQLCLQRRLRVTVFEIQAAEQRVPTAFAEITVGTPSPAVLPGHPREVYKPRRPQETLPTRNHSFNQHRHREMHDCHGITTAASHQHPCLLVSSILPLSGALPVPQPQGREVLQ